MKNGTPIWYGSEDIDINAPIADACLAFEDVNGDETRIPLSPEQVSIILIILGIEYDDKNHIKCYSDDALIKIKNLLQKKVFPLIKKYEV